MGYPKIAENAAIVFREENVAAFNVKVDELQSSHVRQRRCQVAQICPEQPLGHSRLRVLTGMFASGYRKMWIRLDRHTRRETERRREKNRDRVRINSKEK